MNLEVVKQMVPARIRLGLYLVWVVAALTMGAINAWMTITPDWVEAANRSLEYLMVPLGILAAVNVGLPQESEGYIPSEPSIE